ncbi:MAG: hypothetical protein ACK5L7_02430 [Paludibacteraceae bacterium]
MGDVLKMSDNAPQAKDHFEQEFEALKITASIEKDISAVYKWSMFIATVGFIFDTILAMMGVMLMSLNRFAPEFQDFQLLPLPNLMIYVGTLYLLVAVLYFFPILFLVQFSLKIRNAIKNKAQHELDAAFRKMKYIALFIGIVTIVGVILSLFFSVFVGISGAAKSIVGF